jgi:DNA polymerase elongation subunit (family B)
MGEDFAKRLSPWNYLDTRTVTIMGRDQTAYLPSGVSILDYIELYKKFAPGGQSQESYKLDHIAFVETGERKIQFEGNLHTLYKDDYQKFIQYNIKDVKLVENLEDKLKLIELALTLAYDNKCNYDDVFSQIRMWDAIIFNHLKKKNIVIPPIEHHGKDAAFIGAYVKDPIVGMHEWIASYDLNSLYPSLIQQYNISPETILEPSDYSDKHRNIISSGISVDHLLKMDVDISSLKNHTVTPNGHFFRTDKQGFLSELMEEMYNARTVYKQKALAAKKELEEETEGTRKVEIIKSIARYENLQLAKKVSLNSCYGALGNAYFRFFDIRQATAITTAGQLSIRWIENKLNEYMNKLLKTKDEDYVIASDTDSVVGETIIVVDGKKTRIDDYFESNNNDFIKNDIFNDNYVKRVHNGVTPSVNRKTGEVEYKRIKYVMKHLVRKKMYRITVYNGKKVTVTEDHSLIVRSRETGKIYEVKPSQLSAEKHEIINIIATDTD